MQPAFCCCFSEKLGIIDRFDANRKDKTTNEKSYNLVVGTTREALGEYIKLEKIPELIHKGYSTLVGVSALYPALSRIYKLEQLNTAADMQAMDSVSAQRLIGVPVASSVKPTDYPELTRTYINFLQPVLNNSQGTTNILTALKNSGGFQVLPYPQGQGKPESIEFPAKDLSSLLQRIENLNNGIDKALGLDDSGNNNRSQIYAIKSKLVKRLQDVMEARRLGWKEIYLRHLLFKGIYVNPMNFDVQMAYPQEFYL